MHVISTVESVNNTVWFTAFSVVLFAVALAVSLAVWLNRRRKYIKAVEGKHEGEHFVGTRKNKMPVTHHMITPFQMALIGFFVSVVVMFMPYCYYSNAFGQGNWGKAFMAALHGALRIFVLDGEYDVIAEFTAALSEINARVGWFYIVWSWVSYVFAPIFATGIILTLFKNVLAYAWYRVTPFVKNIYVMSELNEKSLALAEDVVIRDRNSRSRIKRFFSRTVILFTDVFEKNEEENYELVARAKSLGAYCVKRDITEIGLRSGKTPILRIPRTRKLYLISENEDENVDQGLKMIDLCRKSRGYNNANTEIYIFSCGAESATLIDTAIADAKVEAPAQTDVQTGKPKKADKPDISAICNIKVRRVDDNYNLILKFLWDNSIFDYAIDIPPSECASPIDAKTRKDDIVLPAPTKLLHVLIVGLGGYGMDILRTLCWFTQMPGYKFVADVFDGEKGAEKFKHVAPELSDKIRDTTDGEPYYDIRFHDEVKFGSTKFDDEIAALKDVSVVFCTLGSDEENIACSMELRKLLGCAAGDNAKSDEPKIFTVVYAPQLSRRLIDRKNNDYGINFIGGIYDRFTEDVIEQAELELYGRVMNLEYAINSTVWNFVDGNVSFDSPVFRELSCAVADVDESILRLFKTRKKNISVKEMTEKVDATQNEYLYKVMNTMGIGEKTRKEIASANAYDRFEYNRRSSIARALHVRWLVSLFCDVDNEADPYNSDIKSLVALDTDGTKLSNVIDQILAKNEHNRWSAYTRSIGYVHSKLRDDIRKKHNMLIPFYELPNGNKLKDRPIGALARYLTHKIAETV